MATIIPTFRVSTKCREIWKARLRISLSKEIVIARWRQNPTPPELKYEAL